MSRQRIRLRDVAERAGTSVATVSRLLNKKSLPVQVRDQTKDRVFAAAKELGYRPNRLARSLVTSSTHIIGLSLPVYVQPTRTLHRWSLHGADVGSLISGILAACYPENYDLIILQRQEFASLDEEAPGLLCADFIDGLIYGAPNAQYDHYSQFLDSGLPMVMLGQEQSGKDIPYVTLNNENEFLRITRALIRKGHSWIALILPERREHTTSEWPMAGYRAAFGEAGVPVDESLIVEDGCPVKTIRGLLRRDKRPTVIIVSREDAAVAILEALKSEGIRCPQDVKIVVFGDDHEFERTQPTLSAVKGDLSGLGYEAAQIMFQILLGERPASKGLNIPWDFVRRESCSLETL